MRRILVTIVAVLSGCGGEYSPVAWGEAEARPIHSIRASGPVVARGAVTRSLTDGVEVALSLVNASQDSLTVEWGVCFGVLRSYERAGLAEPAVWSGEPADSSFCVDVGLFWSGPPGDSAILTQRWDADYFATWPPPVESHLALVIELNDSLQVVGLDDG